MESMLRPVPSLASLLDDGDARKRRIARLSHERELARQLARLDRRLERIRGVFPVWAPAQTKADQTKERAAGANKVDAKERARARMAARYAALVTSDGANVNVNVT